MLARALAVFTSTSVFPAVADTLVFWEDVLSHSTGVARAMVSVFPHTPPGTLMDDPGKEKENSCGQRTLSDREHHDDSCTKIRACHEGTDNPSGLPPQTQENNDLDESKRFHKRQKIELGEEPYCVWMTGEFSIRTKCKHKGYDTDRKRVYDTKMFSMGGVVVAHRR